MIIRAQFEDEQLSSTQERLNRIDSTIANETQNLTLHENAKAQTQAEIDEAAEAIAELQAETESAKSTVDEKSSAVDAAKKVVSRAGKALDSVEKEISSCVSFGYFEATCLRRVSSEPALSAL